MQRKLPAAYTHARTDAGMHAPGSAIIRIGATSSEMHRGFAPEHPRGRGGGIFVGAAVGMNGCTVARVAQVQQSAQATFSVLLERQAEADKIRGVLAMLQRYDSLFRLPTRIRRAPAL